MEELQMIEIPKTNTVKITIEGEAKEVAALVAAIQERRDCSNKVLVRKESEDDGESA